MAKAIKYVYCDANIFLSYFNAYPGRVEVLEQLFEEIHKDETRLIVTSAITIVEVSHIAIEREKGKISTDIENKLDNMWGDSSLIRLIDVHEFLTRNARKLIRQAIPSGIALKPNDAIHLASAQFAGVDEFFTYDKKLFGFGSTMGFKILEPYVNQPKLPL